MHIILTHEQADFDALASLLAAHLLDEEAIPVLPRKMNRNVRAFLTLYGMELPFVDPRDLGGKPIELVTLVDTQSMISVKGMGPDTEVHVIDHHPQRENLAENWTFSLEEVGANTTVLLEALQERNGMLTPIQATLLLLGIYEDTGGLTYTRTTPRDVRAAAYLLEQGASLRIAGDFLNHPLSQQQRELYNRLRDTIEYHTVQGHTILVATGDARGVEEELSTIAHKLRDLLDPDALFLLLETSGGVQMIARSTSDQIDVSEIAAFFGGGGHELAAAALIRERDIQDVKADLIENLPRGVRPSVRVAQIMSRGPQVLRTDTPVEEAAQRMQRYGYEGYPVVEDEQVVGLLTRRAVDRAISHRLNLTAASLMEAGSYTVTPEDSIEHLQGIMTESGWGQVPVVHPENGEIIGIVTRTDLLKTLAPQPAVPGRLNLAGRLEAVLPPVHLALLTAVAQKAHEERCALYIVGGFVRDLLLDRPSLDYDLVVEGDAVALAHSLARQYGGRVTTHSRFGTAKWRIGGQWPPNQMDAKRNGEEAPDEGLPEWLDLVSARTEFYTYPSALPTVERGSIKLDLHRRDFTINTLALRLDGHHWGELHDYWGGLGDLRQGQVRVLHSLSFVDDPTRMLRAVRFEQRFDFRIEERTLELLLEAVPLLDRLSGDRIRHELDHIFNEPKAAQVMSRLDELGLLKRIHPALTWDNWLQSRLEVLENKEPDADWDLQKEIEAGELRRDLGYALWLLRLSQTEVRQVSKRLKLPAQLRSAILAANRLWRDLPQLSEERPSQIVARLEGVPPLSRYTVYRATSDIHLRKVLQNYTTFWQKIQPTIDGHDLRRMGLPPGPAYRRILSTLRDAWLDGEIKTEADEQKLLSRLVAEVDHLPEKHG